MLNLSELVRIYVCLTPTDMRKSFDSLTAIVREGLGYDPLSGHLFVFRSRRGDRVKLLWWDRDGLTLYYRRLEKGTFRFPTTNDPQSRSIEVLVAGVVPDALGHRPGQREATAAIHLGGPLKHGKNPRLPRNFSPGEGIHRA